MTHIKYFMCFVFVEVTFIRAEIFTCLSCSYTRSAIPEAGYGCALTPNIQPTVNCSSPSFCVTIANYEKERQFINSMLRGCLADRKICATDNCCIESGPHERYCEDKCRGSNCNTYNPEQWLSDVGGNPNLPERDTTTARSTSPENNGVTGNAPNGGGNNTNGTTAVVRIHQDLFHVDINAGNRHRVKSVQLAITILLVTCFARILC